MIYLDHHASQPMLPEVQKKLVSLLDWTGNPSSVHQYGQRLYRAIEDVRTQLAAKVGMPDGRVIFTSGATEANNLVLAGHHGIVMASAIEHPAVLGRIAPENILAVDPSGILDIPALETRLQNVPEGANPLVSVMYANNETAVIQPIAHIARLVHQHGGILHVDAVQALGRLDIDMRLSGIDALSIAGHKIGAPPGVGALITPKALPLQAQIIGGGQQYGLRGGTENWLGILGLGAALEWLEAHQSEYIAHLSQLDDELATGLKDSPAVFIARDAPRLAGCALLVAKGLEAQDILMQLDLAGIAVSSGSACSSGTVADSHVLRAMKLDSKIRNSAIRISFGMKTCSGEVQRFLEIYRKIIAD